MLKDMMDMQRDIQELVDLDIFSQEFINSTVLALEDELHEALNETPWKYWKKHQTINKENYKKEIIDCWAFLINLTLSSGMGSKELFERFKAKYLINKERLTGKKY